MAIDKVERCHKGNTHTESSSGVENVVGVDPAGASLDTEGDLHGQADVLCPDTGAKTELGVVGKCDGLLGCAELHHRHNGAENLLLNHRGRRLHAMSKIQR